MTPTRVRLPSAEAGQRKNERISSPDSLGEAAHLESPFAFARRTCNAKYEMSAIINQ